MRRVPLLLGSACFLTLGLRDGTLGVVWPSMRGTFAQPVSALGVLIIAGTVGYVAASLATGALLRRLGHGRVLAAGAALVCAALGAYVVVPAWAALVAAAVVLIAGAGLVDVGVNAYASRAGVRHLGLLHSAYGIGTLVGPLIATAVLVAGASWRLAWGVLLAVEVPLLVALVISRDRWPVATAVAAAPVSSGASSAAGSTWPALVVFFVYVGTEIGLGQWAYTTLTEGRGLATSPAGVAVSGYYGGILAGRLLVAAAGHRVAAQRLVTCGLALALTGALLFTLWVDAVSGSVGLTLAGVGLAPVFPALVALSPGHTSVEAAQAVGVRLAAGALGACALPSLAGVLLQHVALTALGPAALGAIGSLFVMHVAVHQRAESRERRYRVG
jgi:fucose permease